MVKVFSVPEMQSLEKEANSRGLSYEKMMENAGKGLAEETQIAYSHTNNKVLSLVGSGNNGGDALVALTYLAIDQWETSAYIVRPREQDDPLVERLQNQGGKIISGAEDKNRAKLGELLDACDVLLDGVLGTGIKLPLKDEIAQVLQFAKEHIARQDRHIHVVAVDCPSGVDCETGEAAEQAIPADITVTMAGIKKGLISFPAAKITGELRLASIGAIDGLEVYQKNQKNVIDQEYVRMRLPDRPMDAHKGTFGTALIIAGSVNYTGAAYLAGLAAYRSGVGLVTMAIPAPLHETLAGQFPESTWILLPHEVGVIAPEAARVIRQNLDRPAAVLIGPGFGLEDVTKDFLIKLFSDSGAVEKGDIGFIRTTGASRKDSLAQKPVVIDADGLKLTAKIDHWPALLPPDSILTPHPGEMSVLTGLPVEAIQDDRFGTAEKFAREWGHVVVLKGAFSVIAAPDGRVGVIPIATPALARAGTGDVLAGLIVGLRAQGLEAFEAACAGAWIHAKAGLLAAERMGNTASVIAGDVLNAVPQVITGVLSAAN